MWDPPQSRACIGRSPRRSVARTSTPSRETCAPPPTAAPRAKPGTGAPLPPDRPPTGTGTRARIALAPELDHPHAKLIQTSPPSPSRQLITLPLLLMLAAVALGWNLNGYRLFDPDEGRNAEVAREMAQSNDYVVPHLDGLPYLDKPIVYFAAAAAMMKLFGPTEAAGRLAQRARLRHYGAAARVRPHRHLRQHAHAVHHRRDRLVRRRAARRRLGGDGGRRAHQGPDRHRNPAARTGLPRGRDRRPRAQIVSVAGARAVRRDCPAVVCRRFDRASGFPRLRVPPRDVRAGPDAELPPYRTVLVLPAHHPARGVSLDRPGARACETLAGHLGRSARRGSQ